MAEQEGWHQRRKRGVQGKTVEYSIDSLPDEVQAILHACDNSARLSGETAGCVSDLGGSLLSADQKTGENSSRSFCGKGWLN